MALKSGTELGQYEVVASLGAGGMGEVYRARDTKLGRDVAIKVLPEELAQDKERLERFEREARLLAQLNHANIATLYGLEESGGRQYIVMELVEGETLAELIARGAISFDEAVALFVQIADGLEAAHGKGIIHRDLKPANIMITPDGQIKILDFGLAKAVSQEQDVSAATSQSPTLTKGTALGVIMGTAAYMSPEQARGKSVDKRTDVWAFGCCLYEALTGKTAFEGEAVADIIGAVVHKEPRWDGLSRSTPASIVKLLRRCLEKDRKQRLRDLGDAQLELRDPQASEDTAGHVGRWPFVAIGLLSVAVLVLLGWIFNASWKPVDSAVIRFNISPPAGTTFDHGEFSGGQGTVAGFALSPDGKYLVFTFVGSDRRPLRLRSFDATESRALEGTEHGDHKTYPFWSPDSRHIGFFDQGELKRIAVSGGPPRTICEAANVWGATWSRDGLILFGGGQGLSLVAADGGEPEVLDIHVPETALILYPHFLPDGRQFTFGVQANSAEESGLYVGSVDSPDVTRLSGVASSARYTSPDFLLFVQAGTLLAQHFDPEKLELVGDAITVAEKVRYSPGNDGGFSASENGNVAYRFNTSPPTRELAWFGRSGERIERLAEPGIYRHLELSPDGTSVAFQKADSLAELGDIWIDDVSGGRTTRFTFGGQVFDGGPKWSPDGRQIVFNGGGVSGGFQIKQATGAGTVETLMEESAFRLPHDWSSDGRFIVYSANSFNDLWLLPMSDESEPFPLFAESYVETEAQFSPDSRWIAYVSNETGREEIYIQDFPPSGGKWQISTGGGGQPRWRSDGKELFYIASDRSLMAVDITTAPNFAHGAPRALFQTSVPKGLMESFHSHQYDVSPDGQRFLINTEIREAAPAVVTVIVNWPADVESD